ncbi:kinetochore Spc7 family protein [Aerococcus tenax]|uniref:hypothetical protein n=1 Tax=Aerococcus tenax TaxID=3078812 RepID=UPI000DCCCEA6|nr:hypothetical protein [Aerococcus tenax]WIW73922.1 hypothetical protein DBT50_009340 [Aerococcus tenax]
MDREFLKQFGLDKEAIGKILGEYHNSLDQIKEEYKVRAEEVSELEQLKEANSTLEDTIAKQAEELSTYEQALSESQDLLSQEQVNSIKIKTLAEYGLNPNIAKYVKGSTGEEIAADVQLLRDTLDSRPQPEAPMKSLEPSPYQGNPWAQMADSLIEASWR